ncbi:acyltransferase family protein [Sphingobium sp. PNB]|uniref:acyltransferase family protein n=1 Tax=Sphingobium sp. PNB TaxID=863934 RepID=UPI001CA3EF31|nr:acyltransferase family protein [Sphingobium sp. PNB]MCB4860072.1 acyltransferase family protein [Sphingobium sp. PNB]
MSERKASSMQCATQRWEWLDCAKGIGIVTVVVGHAVTGRLHDWIYLFHMPLFFILSGIAYHSEPSAQLIYKRVFSLLLPYGCFLTLLTGMQDAGMMLDGKSWSAIFHSDLLLARRMLFGGRQLTGWFGTAWFITVLFGAQVAFNAMARRMGEGCGVRLIPLLLLMLVIAYPLGGYSLAWNMAVLPMAIFFLGVGSLWASTFLLGGEPVFEGPVHLLIAIVTLLLTPFILPMDMKFGHYGSALTSVAGAIGWSHMIVWLSRWLASGPLTPLGIGRKFALLGRASLVILFMHRMVLIETQPWWPASVRIVAALAVPVLFYLLLERSSPIIRLGLLGLRRPVPPPAWVRRIDGLLHHPAMAVRALGVMTAPRPAARARRARGR